MDCSEVRDILDAYALGAGSPEEATQIESHVAECIRCWDELGKAQRTAALLALSVPMQDVPEGLEDRIMAIARREADVAGRPGGRQPLLRRLRLSWASAAAGLGVASIAALTFAGVLQAQVNDLRSENDRMESQIRGTTQELEDRVRDAAATADNAQALLLSFVSTSSQGVEMKPAGQAQASVWYSWSSDGSDGWVACEHLADAPDGMVYQIWLKEDAESAPAAAFTPEDGDCLLPVDLTALTLTPTGVGLTLEPEAATPATPDYWIAYTRLPIGD